MRLDRLLSITILLLGRDRVTARELAERYEVSVRTIYRDMEALGQAGIPLVSFPGQDGGYGILDSYKLDKQILTVGDMTAILSSLRGLNRAFRSEQLEVVIDKIRALVPVERAAEVDDALEQVVIDVLPWGVSSRGREQFRALQNAVSRQRLVQFTYRGYEGAVTDRTIEPLTLVFKSYAWYLWGWCRLREDYRLFRLSRIRDTTVLDESFVRRPGRYRDSQMETAAGTRVPLTLRFPPDRRVRIEEIFPPEEISIADDGSVRVRTVFPEGEWIYEMLLSFGPDMEVEKPLAVREELAARAKKIADRHSTLT